MSPVLIWFLVGLGLVLLEFVVPGVVLVFFGVAAWVVTVLVWAGWVDNTAIELLIFIVVSLGLLFGCRRYVKAWFVGDTAGAGVDGLEEILGKQVRVLADIPGGADTGKVELKGAEWRARGDIPMPSGSLARVTARDGLVLIVQPL